MDLKQVQRNWEGLAATDPYWAILTVEGTEGGRWDLDAFFQTGVEEIGGLMRYLEPLGLGFGHRRALDFGCGAGRLTQALAEHFDEVHGVDIAPGMLDLARRHNRHPDRCHFHLNESDDLRAFPDGHFDLIYSNITLQHMPPLYATQYLREFLRLLAAGGVLVFQLPAEPIVNVGAARGGRGVVAVVRAIVPRFLWEALRAVRSRILRRPHMDMYGTPRAEVEAFLARLGGRIVDVAEDHSAGPHWRSYRYCVTPA
jgi:SAM-dependent methyltransferase